MSTRVGLIGAGKLGSALGKALAGVSGLELTCIAAQRPERARRLAAELGPAVRVTEPVQLLAQADLVWLAVPDAVVEPLCASLPWQPHHAVVHTAGALGLSALASARARGARIGAFHPLQAFPEGAGPAAFAGIFVGIEAEASLEASLLGICRALSAEALPLAGVDRAGYHAAAVFASNYVVALHAAAAQAFELSGLAPSLSRRALLPLTLGAAQNLAQAGEAAAQAPTSAAALVAALTGPLSRGDVETVRGHLAVLSLRSELASLYRALGRQLLSLPLSLDAETRAELARLFSHEG